MTQQAATATVNRTQFQMTHITRTAAHHALSMDPVHLRAVIDHLLEPQPAQECTRVHGRPGTRHFRVNGSLRVSFVRRCDRTVVVHVGLHPDFDKFAQRTGTPSVSSAMSIEQFIMKTEKVPKTSTPRAARPSQSLPNGRIAAEADRISALEAQVSASLDANSNLLELLSEAEVAQAKLAETLETNFRDQLAAVLDAMTALEQKIVKPPRRVAWFRNLRLQLGLFAKAMFKFLHRPVARA